jgi:NitT/TauT family transport system permease protein
VRRGAGSLATSAAAVAAGLVAWAALASLRVVPDYMLPSPSDVAAELVRMAARGLLWSNVATTVDEALLGFLLAFAVGALLAYPLAKSRLVASVLSPYVAAMQAMPILALAPLLVVWFGLGLLSKTLICAIIVFFPILVNIAVGLRTVSRDVVESAATEGAGAWTILFHIEVPLALRTILAGVRMGLTLSMTGAIVAEFVASSSGLGYLMLVARSEYDAPMLFVAALSMVALAVAGYLLVMLLEHALVTWD